MLSPPVHSVFISLKKAISMYVFDNKLAYCLNKKASLRTMVMSDCQLTHAFVLYVSKARRGEALRALYRLK